MQDYQKNMNTIQSTLSTIKAEPVLNLKHLREKDKMISLKSGWTHSGIYHGAFGNHLFINDETLASSPQLQISG